jgi:hypothetical protein
MTYAGTAVEKKKARRSTVIPGVERCVVPVGTPWARLAEVCQQLSSNFGYAEALLVAHVLADAPLFLPPYRLQSRKQWTALPSGQSVFRETVHIDVLIPSAFTSTAGRAAAERIRHMMFPRGTPPALNDREVLLQSLVTGSAPRGHGLRTRYWEAIRLKYNRRRPAGSPRYTTWRSPMMAHRRLQEKLKRRRMA